MPPPFTDIFMLALTVVPPTTKAFNVSFHQKAVPLDCAMAVPVENITGPPVPVPKKLLAPSPPFASLSVPVSVGVVVGFENVRPDSVVVALVTVPLPVPTLAPLI